MPQPPSALGDCGIFFKVHILSQKYQSVVFSLSFRIYYYRCTFAVFNSTFGIACNNNNLASGSSYNVFENRSRNNVVAAYCESITFGIGSCDVAIKKSFMRYITFEAGVAYLDISCSATTSSATYGQNIRFRSGVAGAATSRKLATITSANNSFLTTFGNSADVSGTLRLSTQV